MSCVGLNNNLSHLSLVVPINKVEYFNPICKGSTPFFLWTRNTKLINYLKELDFPFTLCK